METIKNYLEAMFANLPNTEEVRKAKAELLQIMEDKYNELIEEGATENSAVGTVISEFGNLDELSEELGLTAVTVREAIQEEKESGRRFVSMDEAKEYLAACALRGNRIGVGVMLCIMCVIGPIVSDMMGLYDGIGVLLMFGMIAFAVALFVHTGVTFSKWDFIKKELCQIDMMTANMLSDEKNKYASTHAMRLTVGVVLCAICWLPAAVCSDISFLADMGGAFLFIFVGVGVYLLVSTSCINDSIDTLLKLNDSTKISGHYNKDQETEYISEGATVVMEIFWPVITCLYLIWSFMTFDWYISWIIWPLAAIVHAILKMCLRKR